MVVHNLIILSRSRNTRGPMKELGALCRRHSPLKRKILAPSYFPTGLPTAVSSALASLTSVFGMGTGVTSPL
jgi:hypothetical protein